MADIGLTEVCVQCTPEVLEIVDKYPIAFKKRAEIPAPFHITCPAFAA